MKPTKKQLKEIEEIQKKEANVCDANDCVCNINDGVVDEITGLVYPKKTTEVTLNDKGAIINKETGKLHFQELMKRISSEKKSNNIDITISFGVSSPLLKKQLKKQGFKISDAFIIKAEMIRTDLNCLKKVGILKQKELIKCFKRLNKSICDKVFDSELKDGEKAVLIKQKFTK